MKLSQNWIFRISLIIITIFFITLYYGAYKTFNCNWSEDIGLLNQLMYNFVHHFSFDSTIYHFKNSLGDDHFRPIFLLFYPIYLLFQNAFTLIALSVIFVSIAAYLLVIISERFFEDWRISLIFFIIFMIYPASINTYLRLGGARENAFILAFLFLALLSYLDNKYIPFLVASTLASLCTEYTSLILVGFGIVALIHKKPLKWVLFPLIFGTLYFYIIGGVVMPYLKGTSSAFAGPKFGEYSYLGNTPLKIIKTLLFNPIQTLKILFQPYKIHFLITLLFPLGFFSIVGIEYLLIPISQFLLILLTKETYYANISWWYDTPLIPFVFVGAMVGIKRLSLLKKHQIHLRSLIIIISLTSLFSCGNFISKILVYANYFKEINQPVWKYINEIPKHDSISAQVPFLAEFSSRKRLYLYPDQSLSSDYIILGVQRNKWPISEESYYNRLKNILLDSPYGVVEYFTNGDLVFKKGYSKDKNNAVFNILFNEQNKIKQKENLQMESAELDYTMGYEVVGIKLPLGILQSKLNSIQGTDLYSVTTSIIPIKMLFLLTHTSYKTTAYIRKNNFSLVKLYKDIMLNGKENNKILSFTSSTLIFDVSSLPYFLSTATDMTGQMLLLPVLKTDGEIENDLVYMQGKQQIEISNVEYDCLVWSNPKYQIKVYINKNSSHVPVFITKKLLVGTIYAKLKSYHVDRE